MAKKLTITFKNRDFTARMVPAGLRFQVNSYGFGAIGGCKEASISMTGGRLGLWDAINMLRCAVEIYNPQGAAVWWGFVHEAQVRMGALEVAISLDSMVNRVAVAYSFVEPGTASVGRRKTTAWADDLDSQAEFGIKEWLSSGDGMSDTSAINKRTSILIGQAWPQGGLSQFGGVRGRVRYSGAKQSLSATLICHGWWDTLGWEYASVALTGATSLESGTLAAQAVGAAAGNTKILQQFKVGTTAINIKSIEVDVNKVNAPADNLVAEIWALDATTGLPIGTALASGNTAGSGLGTSAGWVRITFSAEKNLEAATVYGLVISRSGAVDGTNYYQVQVDTGLGYADGFSKLWNGSAWVDRSPNADMLFKIFQDNNVESTTQIDDLVGHFGQFLAGTYIEAASGVYLPSYQNGEKLTLKAIEGLLAAGGVNGRRLLATVDINRRVIISEEPATSTCGLWMDAAGQVYESGGRTVSEYAPPVGGWVRLKDVIPGVVDLTKLVDPSLQFIEGARWSADQGAQYTFKGKPSVESVLSIG